MPELSRVVNTKDTPFSETNIVGNFTNIATEATTSKFYGGAIYNYGDRSGVPEITSITGTFSGNSNYSSSYNTRGGVIYNTYYAQIGAINGDFTENSSITTGDQSASGGAIYNSNYATIEKITGNFVGNYAKSDGNKDVSGGAILNTSHATIGEIRGDFIGNSVTSTGGGKAYGGAIHNYASDLTLVDSSFINNSVITESIARNGGAIDIKAGTVNIIAEQKDVIFSGNFIASKDNGDGTFENKESNAINVGVSGILNLNAGSNKIIFNDKITSKSLSVPTANATININSDTVTGAPTNGTIILNEDMSNYIGKVNLFDGTIKLGENGKFFAPSNFNVVNGTLDTANGVIETTSLGNLSITDRLNLYFDADLKSGDVDKIFSNNIFSDEGKINIAGINFLSEADVMTQSIKLVDDSIKDAVVYGGSSVVENKIFRYNVNYDPVQVAGGGDCGSVIDLLLSMQEVPSSIPSR